MDLTGYELIIFSRPTSSHMDEVKIKEHLYDIEEAVTRNVSLVSFGNERKCFNFKNELIGIQKSYKSDSAFVFNTINAEVGEESTQVFYHFPPDKLIATLKDHYVGGDKLVRKNAWQKYSEINRNFMTPSEIGNVKGQTKSSLKNGH